MAAEIKGQIWRMFQAMHLPLGSCVSPVIVSFLTWWGDALSEYEREQLTPYFNHVAGTATGMVDEARRAWLVTDWMVRGFLPTWLRMVGMEQLARELAALTEITGEPSYRTLASHTLLGEERFSGDAARDRAYDDACRTACHACNAASIIGNSKPTQWHAGYSDALELVWESASATVLTAIGDADRYQSCMGCLQASAMALLDRLIMVPRQRCWPPV